VRGGDGALRIVYVTEGTGVGGGHRDIFEQANRLAARGHDVSLYTLGPSARTGSSWLSRCTLQGLRRRLIDALAPLEAIKVATWWNTAAPVWLASVRNGIPVYFVQDIETSYYPHDERTRLRCSPPIATSFAT
jgi:hypothetical protein